MTSQRTRETLAKHGFAYDERVTGCSFYWAGTIDPIGRFSIGDECRGIAVSGNTRSEMDAEAIPEAKAQKRFLRPCTDPDCEFHNTTELEEN